MRTQRGNGGNPFGWGRRADGEREVGPPFGGPTSSRVTHKQAPGSESPGPASCRRMPFQLALSGMARPPPSGALCSVVSVAGGVVVRAGTVTAGPG